MNLRLTLHEDEIALRFNISRFCVSQILSTRLPFLPGELTILFSEQHYKRLCPSYYPQCFKQCNGCGRCIIHCTEIRIQRLSLAATSLCFLDALFHFKQVDTHYLYVAIMLMQQEKHTDLIKTQKSHSAPTQKYKYNQQLQLVDYTFFTTTHSL